MSPRARLILFAIAAAFVLIGVAHIVWHMPDFGAHPLPYGDAINAAGTAERHVTNMVSAVNFDYRGIDTLGEEFMLLAAVTGVSVLLRGTRGEQTSARPVRVEGRSILPRSDAVVLTSQIIGPLVLLFGLYVVLHAMTTPGGGFQGGVIVASGLMLIYLGDGYTGWRKLMRSELLDISEGGGASLFALGGFVPMLMGLPFLTNILPLGTAKGLFSGGLMLISNAGVAFAVIGGFGVLFLEFTEETRELEEQDKAP